MQHVLNALQPLFSQYNYRIEPASEVALSLFKANAQARGVPAPVIA